MRWDLWVRGVVAATINGAANAIVVIVVDPTTFNLQTGWKNLLLVMAVSGLFGMASYLKAHPLPEEKL